MPHVLIRTADGNFRLTELDGSSYTISGTSYDVPKWDDAIVGDDVTNPDAIILRSFDMHDMDIPKDLKADGIAAGKGVIICENIDDAINASRQILEQKKSRILDSWIRPNPDSRIHFLTNESPKPE